MTAPVQTGIGGFLSRFERLRERLPGDPRQRLAAADAFRRAGLPGAAAGRREEAWKYTSLRPVADAEFQQSVTPLTSGSAVLERLPRIDAPRIVLVDGVFDPALSTLPASVTFTRFADQPAFGTLARPNSEPLVALNTMLAEDGVSLAVSEGVDAGLLLLVSLATNGAAFHPRHAIQLAQGARLTLLELSVGDGAYLHNPVIEVHVAEHAALTHVRLQNESSDAFHLSTLYAEVAECGTYDSFALNVGARIVRTEVHARLDGEKGTTHLNGAQLLGGSQHADFTTVVQHVAPSCTSRQTVKNVLDGRAQGVFQGRIEVAREAQKTDGYQMNQALLLSPDAEIDTKPELEIFADDVKCSHGATVGELDADQLFYLRSRGIPDAEARSILVRAFLAEALDAVAHEQVRAVLEQAVEGWWERQAA
ncbi:MAG TPA: Fe-S cluster assembly protein SufD [Acetobacteraceae bacterium]|jgi:Fe-S cluster assembly protein SufD|nr:Fe-S cluster assembly protein SufD [Acetobacteraceae bacterium]